MIQNTKGKQTINKYYLLASTNLEKKDFKSAKSNLLKYLNKNRDYQALNLLGICYLNLNEYLNAANIFKKLIKFRTLIYLLLHKFFSYINYVLS